MAREDQRIEQEAKAAADRVVQEEALAVAKSVAQEEVRARVSVHPLPGAVLEFLVEQWLKLMMLIHVKRGVASDAWKNALEAMDQLIWSVQPKDSSDDRRKLATIVPPLIKRIGAGMEAAGIEHEVREFFFAELMKIHTRIMGAPMKGKDEAAAAPAVASAAAAAPDFTSSVTIRNPYGAGEVQVSASELAEADSAANASHRGYGSSDANYPDDLKQGDWVEFKVAKEGENEAGKEERRPVRLIFVSPRKTRYIFSDRGEKEYIECTRSELTRRFRTGEALYMEEEPEVPFFERIMGGVISKMRGAPAAA